MTDIVHHRTPDSKCLNCAKLVNSATEAFGDGPQPNPGDICICFYCHHLMLYDDNLTPRELTDAEIVEVAGDPELVRAMGELAKFKAWEKQQKEKGIFYDYDN